MWQTVTITLDKRMRCVLWLTSMLSVFGGDVPLFIEPTEKYSEAIYKERTDKNYILEHVILPDLKKAEGLINRNKNYERKRISICGVWAIMADAYMWAEEYNLADQTIDKMADYCFVQKGGRFVDFEPTIPTWHTMFTEELNNKPSDDTPENDEYNSTKVYLPCSF